MYTKLLSMMMILSIFNARLLYGSDRNFYQGEPAVGFQYDDGPQWSCICHQTPHGNIPGKVNDRGEAYYSWGGKEHSCPQFEVVSGALIYYSEPLPSTCVPKGYQNDTGEFFYNAVIGSNDGMVPGKAHVSLHDAFYPYGGKEHVAHVGFYIVC